MAISLKTFAATLNRYAPAIFFLGGFVWDALTIGRYVQAFDLMMLAGYLIAAAGILFYLSNQNSTFEHTVSQSRYFPAWLKNSVHLPRAPYFAIQFLFGSLLSALFLLYFKSSGHWLAWVWSLALAGLLVGNEFLEDKYNRLNLCWTLFGFCTMLFFNFALPFLLGSIHAAWFYLSTSLGAGLTYALYLKTPRYYGRLLPVWLVAGALMLAYRLDVIPPVPLVKRDIAVGLALQKTPNTYQITLEKSPWYVFWRDDSNTLHVPAGEKVYCVSAVFAPQGLRTRLYHRWQFYHAKQGWQTASRIGFALNGGRFNGYRGYTYKQNVPAGQWRVAVETETGRTLTVHDFTVAVRNADEKPEPLIKLF